LQFANNTPVGDFFCPHCSQEFELKSNKIGFTNHILDGAYRSMLSRIQADNNPNFFLMKYSVVDLSVTDFFVVPKHFIVPSLIRPRKPLTATARRAGWVGCNIALKEVPASGKIYLIKSGRVIPQEIVLSTWKKTVFLSNSPVSTRGWTIEVLRLLEGLPKQFSLADVYNFEAELRNKFPQNRHIKDKIRQQLQVLRDRGILYFLGKGQYLKNSVYD
jgi:type II restriction enzyme